MPDTLLTSRLSLIPSNRKLIQLCLENPSQFASALDATLAPGWPLESHEEDLPWVLKDMKDNETGWWVWWILLRPELLDTKPLVIGNVGFKGPPENGGLLEVTFAVAERYQGRAYATEALTTLVAWSLQQTGVKKIWGDTTPTNFGSMNVFQRSGFTLQEHESDESYLLYSMSKCPATAKN